MDQDPPSTQVAGGLFVDSAGRPLKVFVDAALVNRVKVGRTLKKGGANITSELKDADLVIVETESQTGDTTAADWGFEKVVLQSGWVSHSVHRGKAFLAGENWGGFIATPVGGGSVASDTGENHLPTPRVTPSEAKLPPNEPPMSDQHPTVDASQAVQATSPGPPPLQFPPQTAFQIPGGQHIGGAMPMAAISPDAQVVVPANLLWSLINQPGMGIAMQMPQFHNPLPMAMSQGGFPQQGVQLIPSGIFHQGGFPPQGVYPQQMVGMPMSQPTDGQPPSSGPLPGSASPSVQPRRSDDISESYRGSPMDQDEPLPSLKRKAGPSDSSASKRRGKAREGRPSKHARLSESFDEAPLPFTVSSPPASQRRRPTPDQVATLFTKDDGTPYTFFVQIEIRNRTKLADAIKKNGGKIGSDIAKVDFVILAHPSQRNFEEWLRQSNYFGKVPIKPQWVYRSVEQGEILDLNEYVYEGFKVEKKRGRPGASGQRYVLKVVKSPTTGGTTSEEDEPEDDPEDDEEIDRLLPSQGKEKGKEKGAVKKPTIVKKEAVKAEKKAEKKVEKKSGKPAEPVKTKAKSKTKSKESSPTPTQTGHWEPSPPPPTRTEPHNRGHLYTKEDLDYCDEYIPILLNRDPSMSIMLISEKLNEKMPHHSTKSWASHLSHSSRRDKVTNWRRRAEILHRKVVEQRSTSREQSTSHRAGPSKSPMAPQKVNPLQFIASFFAQGNADNLSDEEVWKMMEGQCPQLTAWQWEEVWVNNSDDISAEVSRLTGMEDSQVPKTEPE